MKYNFNDEAKAEMFFRETKTFYQVFGCDFNSEKEGDKKKTITRITTTLEPFNPLISFLRLIAARKLGN